jgi:hypothetical protein
MRARFARSRLAAAVVACLGIGFDCATLRFVWLRTRLAPGQYQVGYFEEPDGVASLVLDNAQHGSVEPDVGLDSAGRLSLPPGRSIGVPLAEGVEYRVRLDDSRSWAPFCVLGSWAALADEKNRPAAFRLAGGRTMALGDGRVGVTDWTVVRSWRADQQSLEALRERCARGDALSSLIVRQRPGYVDLEYGACSYRLTEPVEVMAVLAGPAWTSVEKAGGWRTERSVQTGPLLFVGALAVLQVVTAAVAVGVGPAGILAAAAFGLTEFVPELGIIGLVLLLLVSFAAAGIRMIGIYRVRSALGFGLGCLLLLTATMAVLRPFLSSRLFPREQFIGRPARCLLLGYSAIRGDSLRRDRNPDSFVSRGGAWEGLNRCATCAGSMERRAQGAGRFSWVRDMLCSGASCVLADGDVLFFGGSNDDFFWTRFHAYRLLQMAGLARYAYARPTAPDWQRIRESVEADSLGDLDTQIEAVEQALRCVAAHGARFHYFHDFPVWDLAQPRSDARQRMRAARAETVRHVGGGFVDVFEQVADEAGVWWFNDYIHPSEIGHRRIGELMAGELGRR